ncbi:hypothetical protein T06_10623 [Trichinella sp. T6]|nr:hypothetical protein T06_10623 [Trichinella sp. T6]
MLLATAFLPVPHIITGATLLEAGTTGNLAALFQYFRQEWITDETNSHLEGWHNRLNKKAGGNKLGLHKLFHLPKEEQA